MITKSQIHEAQKKWGSGIVKIGALKDNESECLEFTKSFLNSLYDFENNDVLFKPTKASEKQFRPNFQMALSYFLGCLLYTSPSPRDVHLSRMPSSA